MARREILFRGWCRKLVPRTAQLAVITAKHTIANQWPQCFRNCGAQFDREIGNTFARIQYLGADKGLGRAHLEAGRAGSAMKFGPGIYRQRQIGEKLAEKKPGARPLIDLQVAASGGG